MENIDHLLESLNQSTRGVNSVCPFTIIHLVSHRAYSKVIVNSQPTSIIDLQFVFRDIS